MTEGVRLDVALVRRGLAASRQRAQGMIAAGCVKVNGRVVLKPAHLCAEADDLAARDPLAYVGRGGLKLAAGLDRFGIGLAGRVCLDAGASTGGFTDCMLQRGAARVFAVDVGAGQLAPALRADSRVVVMENTDIRRVASADLGGGIAFAACDLSFISLEQVLPAVGGLLDAAGQALVLVKPQFEAGRAQVGKHGLVKSARVHQAVLERLAAFCRELALWPVGCMPSPVTGGEGNIEFLLHLDKNGPGGRDISVEQAVSEAHRLHGK